MRTVGELQEKLEKRGKKRGKDALTGIIGQLKASLLQGVSDNRAWWATVPGLKLEQGQGVNVAQVVDMLQSALTPVFVDYYVDLEIREFLTKVDSIRIGPEHEQIPE